MRKLGTTGVALVTALVLLLSQTANANLILNSGFETGTFADWTVTNAPIDSGIEISATDPHSGTHDAYFGGTSVGSYDRISQSVSTVSGDDYQISYWLTNIANTEGVSTPNDFYASWNGSEIAGSDELNSDAFSYTLFTFVEPATSSSTALQFSGYHIPAEFLLDDVSVTDLGPASSTPLPAAAWPGLAMLAALGLFAARRRIAAA